MKITCGIYLYSTRLKKVLVCHATNSRWNTWSIPKGLKEEQEDVFTAAERELYEETGIALKDLNVLKKQVLPPVNYKKQKKLLESFLIICDSDLEQFAFRCISLTEKAVPEIDRWQWIEPEQMPQLLHESQYENYELIKKLLL